MQKSYTFTSADGTVFPYYLSIPEDCDPASESLPLIVFLHGAGERGTDVEKVKVHGIPKYFDKESPCRVITLSPQCAENRIWNTQVYAVKELIDYIVKEYNIDHNAISLTGLSMGGYGTWEMGMSFPGFFAALAPICGGGTSWRAGLLKDTPIRTFHGADDNTVPITQTLEMYNAVKARGGNIEIEIYGGVGHDSWVTAYEKTDLIKWLAKARK
ncbi:MAG: dienelactone hydrolase family protein [Clostridia bacterium]|nr:dienelactone hydrolase family protein [Clostridia bacterium]